MTSRTTNLIAAGVTASYVRDLARGAALKTDPDGPALTIRGRRAGQVPARRRRSAATTSSAECGGRARLAIGA